MENLAMESTPNKIAMEKKDSGAEFEQQDKIKIVRKKNSKNMKNSTKVVTPRFPIHLRPWIEKYVDRIAR